SRRRHTRSTRDWSSDVCSSDLVGDPVARELEVAAEVAAQAREDEQVVERPASGVEVLVPVVGGADHAVAEAVRRDGELDRHRRQDGKSVVKGGGGAAETGEAWD